MKFFKEGNEIYILTENGKQDFQFELKIGGFNKMLAMQASDFQTIPILKSYQEISKSQVRSLFKKSDFLNTYKASSGFERKIKNSIEIIEKIEKKEKNNKKVLEQMLFLKEEINRKKVYCVYKDDELLNEAFDLLLNKSKNIIF